MHRQNPPRLLLMRTRAGLFIFTNMQYTNSPLTIAEQIALLKSRGLLFADEEKASLTLEHISYYRFASYLRPMEIDRETHNLRPGTSFENTISIYQFDEKLRTLIFAAIQKIEISLRSKLIHEFSITHGAFWFFDQTCFVNKHRFVEGMNVLEKELNRSKDEFIRDHIARYGKEEYPPAWKILELASFGTISKLFANFSYSSEKKRIARSYGVPQHEILKSWTAAIGPLRNCCAHHSRLWNRIFPITPLLPSRMREPWITNINVLNNRFYAVLCCVAYLLQKIAPDNTLSNDIANLINSYPNIPIAAMGFPSDWQSEPLWHRS